MTQTRLWRARLPSARERSLRDKALTWLDEGSLEFDMYDRNWCRRSESNRHRSEATSSSGSRVYQSSTTSAL